MPLPDSVVREEDEGINRVHQNPEGGTSSSASHSEQGASSNSSIVTAGTDSSVSGDVSNRQVPRQITDSLKRGKSFEYANDPAYWEKTRLDNNNGTKSWLDKILQNAFFIWAMRSILIGILVFALYRIIVVNKIYLFYSGSYAKKKEEEKETFDNPRNLEELIGESMAVQDIKTAVRFMHLKALVLMGRKDWIRFKMETTNQEYLVQMKSGHPEYADEFTLLTNLYEHIWFGGFRPGSAQSDLIVQRFNNFYSKLDS